MDNQEELKPQISNEIIEIAREDQLYKAFADMREMASEASNRYKTEAEKSTNLELANKDLTEKYTQQQSILAEMSEQLNSIRSELSKANRDAQILEITPEQLANSSYLRSLGYSDVSKAILDGRLKVRPDKSA